MTWRLLILDVWCINIITNSWFIISSTLNQFKSWFSITFFTITSYLELSSLWWYNLNCSSARQLTFLLPFLLNFGVFWDHSHILGNFHSLIFHKMISSDGHLVSLIKRSDHILLNLDQYDLWIIITVSLPCLTLPLFCRQ